MEEWRCPAIIMLHPAGSATAAAFTMPVILPRPSPAPLKAEVGVKVEEGAPIPYVVGVVTFTNFYVPW
uniref:Uncharacterized protein n=1 Tax=Chromera velia CCMP2878 TaxID=1169474 RepID=A0A0G4FBT7_9ALVE|eukprot:Cvel_16231.t1-p1 / transcript=Cvel_16231.t1 / gene=Cvel_16231 / organism=Chromera_velia_CCMP2878 / gene_product=hypothetical protein / transcript_product=hypothetical protein / location=Cvel_scaffold1241:23721-24753(+) / protein_length=67 / sequence_SO=supercontig / SO=protein_coding / is_pseudo=false